MNPFFIRAVDSSTRIIASAHFAVSIPAKGFPERPDVVQVAGSARFPRFA
jgi:hypothetical protein